jgi:hypothetical protein
MNEEALELAEYIDKCPDFYNFGQPAGDIIRKLVRDFDKVLQQNERLLDTVFKLKEELACANDYIKQYQAEKASEK